MLMLIITLIKKIKNTLTGLKTKGERRMKILQTINEFYWFKILTKCPLCHSKLMEVGHGADGYQGYKCKCGWGANVTYGAWNNPNVKVKGEVR